VPFIKQTSKSDKERILISGVPNSGKTTSLGTFIYGLHNDEPESPEALKYADGKQMVILTCPGEKGTKSLPVGDHITSYVYEADPSDITSDKWSADAVSQFQELTSKVISEQPDILAVDGLHSLHSQILNKVTKVHYSQERSLVLHYMVLLTVYSVII